MESSRDIKNYLDKQDRDDEERKRRGPLSGLIIDRTDDCGVLLAYWNRGVWSYVHLSTTEEAKRYASERNWQINRDYYVFNKRKLANGDYVTLQ